MRGLIRAGLFAVARVAILATVVVWMMSHSLAIYSSAGDLAGVVVHRQGWIVQFPGHSRWELQVCRLQELTGTDAVFETSSTVNWLSVRRIAPGLFFSNVTVPAGRVAFVVAIRHWLAIAVAILFYVLTKLIYRKQTSPPAEDAPCEA